MEESKEFLSLFISASSEHWKRSSIETLKKGGQIVLN